MIAVVWLGFANASGAAAAPLAGVGLVEAVRSEPLLVPAQAAAEPYSQRHCQTIRACNFRPGGAFRGCISSYSCRSCRFVRTTCRVVGGRRVCEHRSRCDWAL